MKEELLVEGPEQKYASAVVVKAPNQDTPAPKTKKAKAKKVKEPETFDDKCYNLCVDEEWD